MESNTYFEVIDMPIKGFAIKEKIYEHDSFLYCFYPHWHNHMEFLYVMRGSLNINCSGKNMDVVKNDLVVFNCNEVHSGRNNGDCSQYYCLIVDMKLLQSKTYDECERKFILPLTLGQIRFQNVICDDSRINRIMESIMQEFAKKEVGYELQLKSLLYSLLTIMVRDYKADDDKKNNSQVRNTESILNVLTYMQEHYQESIKLSDLAQIAGLSEAYFCRSFKSVTGMTPLEHLNYVRIMKANEMLLSNNINVTEAALAVGISNPNYFSRLYKKWLFKSPRTAQKNIIV